jgi:acyl-CoA thioester hydrolase
MKRKIYYHDTDAGGVVYYANYLKYFEEARTEFFSSIGIDLKALQDKGILFVVAKVEVDYQSPAHYQEELDIEVNIKNLRNASFSVYYRITEGAGARLIVEAQTKMVCVNKDLGPIKIPDDILAILHKNSVS